MKKLLLLSLPLLLAMACAKKQVHKTVVSHADFNKGQSFYKEGNTDSAYHYFNEVVKKPEDSLDVSSSYSYIAFMQSDVGDYYGAIESTLASLKFINGASSEDSVSISANYAELGLNSWNLKDYDRAITYLDRAIKYASEPSSQWIILNNKANVYRDLKDYTEALKILDDVEAKSRGDKNYARYLTNFAITKWLQDSNYNAAPELLKALKMRVEQHDKLGQNSSYSHLSDYYSKTQPDSGILYADKMLRVADEINSPDDKLEAVKKLIDLAPSHKTKTYFHLYNKLRDSLQNVRNSSRNQFALTRYETEQAKSDNLKLEYKLAKREFLLIGGAVIFFAFLVIAILWYRKRKQKMELEAENSIRESKLRTSKKVHDVVANGLYRVMTEIENQTGIDREEIVDRIDRMYQKSRDISYEVEDLKPIETSYADKVETLLNSFGTRQTKIFIAGNSNSLWEPVNQQSRTELEHILQELMVNMRKHSGATEVVLKFKRTDQKIYVDYSDNGTGMKSNTSFNNGLKNTGNRIDHIHGEITFDTKVEQGLNIHISFPLYY